MAKPDGEDDCIKNINTKKNRPTIGIEDDIVTCQHCRKDFSCDKVRTLNQALQMQEQTIKKPGKEKSVTEAPDSPTLEVEPEKKKRKTTKTTDKSMSEGLIELPNPKDSHIPVCMKQALQKLGEIPLLEYHIKKYKQRIMEIKNMWRTHTVTLDAWETNLTVLRREKRQRTKLIKELNDIIYNKGMMTSTEKVYDTNLGFLEENPVLECNYCHTKEASKISCYCKDCRIFICDNCVIEHRMKNKNHKYWYQIDILREYGLTDSWKYDISEIIDIKCMAADILVILNRGKLCTYKLTGVLINIHTFGTSLGNNSRMTCINDCKVAVTEPEYNQIHIVTIVPSIATTDLGIPVKARMTGGITCRMDILYVAFSDAIRSMDLSGQIQRVIDIPNVNILHSVNNNKMLCVYSKDDSDKTMSCLDLTNGNLYNFERFPFHLENVTTDDVGNIIFIVDSVIWQADSDGKNIKININQLF